MDSQSYSSLDRPLNVKDALSYLDDIVRARLRTVGIQEHRIVFKHGPWDNPKGIPLTLLPQ